MFKWLTLSLVIILLDQVTKYFASHVLSMYQPIPIVPGFNLTLMHNTGAAFSFLSQAGGWQRWFFIGIASVVSIVIIVWMNGLPKNKYWLLTALALILGGAIGNVCDRIILGYVIDFIEVYYGDMFWPAFNIADSAITIGAIMLIIDSLFLKEAEIEN
ncbi:MAG: signal peptidase II [Legionellales bacterium]|nr:signal peptidase II [Legionellales bacterium]